MSLEKVGLEVLKNSVKEAKKPKKNEFSNFIGKNKEGTENKDSEFKNSNSDNKKLKETTVSEHSDEKKGEIKEPEFYTSYDERLSHTPLEGERGSWTGRRGESEYIPNSEIIKEKLGEYNKTSIEYKKGIPDFKEITIDSVDIDMTGDRIDNFKKAYEQFAEKWNKEGKDGKTDWKPRDVKEYNENNRLTIHEEADRKTVRLVDTETHQYFGHVGGRKECEIRDSKNLNKGVFDE